MSDELDARLLRCFAASHRPLADAQFVARVTAQLHPDRGRSFGPAVRGALRALYTGLAAGIAAPLRLRYAGLMALAVAAVTLWSVLQPV
jgi:hypothetical protein